MNKLRYPIACLLVACAQLFGMSASAAEAIIVGRSRALTGGLKGYGEAKRDGGDAYIS